MLFHRFAKYFVLDRPPEPKKPSSPPKPTLPYPSKIDQYVREAEQYKISLAQRRECFPKRYKAMAQYVREWDEDWNRMSGDDKRNIGCLVLHHSPEAVLTSEQDPSSNTASISTPRNEDAVRVQRFNGYIKANSGTVVEYKKMQPRRIIDQSVYIRRYPRGLLCTMK